MKNDIALVRHSLAHLLAAAVLELYPTTKTAIGPATDTGFYYDFDFTSPISDKGLSKIEQKMREIAKSWKTFDGKELSKEDALAMFADNPYKIELINEIAEKGEKITVYTSGEFTDLCRGGHVENMKDVDLKGFELSHIAGAYWRGSEKNKMLTRVYGLAFESKEALEAYKKMREEAEKRDHKKLGKELDLFVFSDLVGSGLPLWTPRGQMVRTLLDEFVWQLRKERGYERVEIPHITKKDLYVTSGHWDKFKDELFRITTREGHEFAMKPMNCPHHTQIYARKQWSYRELPQRYANTTACYRDEQSGELAGLSRTRSFCQDDAHVFCRSNQVKEEFLKIWDIIHTFYGAFGFTLKVRLSLHDPAKPENYLGDAKIWKLAEDMLREIIAEKKVDALDGVGEAAFYGPKLDFMAHDSLGRQWQVATIQLDMNMPENFDLICINEKSEKERIVMIHAAIMGSLERFMSIMIEHTAGIFPLWLSPTQAVVIPIAEAHNEYAQKVAEQLQAAGIRVSLDDSKDNFGKRVRKAKTERTPYFIIIGDKDIAANAATLESRDQGQIGQHSVEEIVARLAKEITEKK